MYCCGKEIVRVLVTLDFGSSCCKTISFSFINCTDFIIGLQVFSSRNTTILDCTSCNLAIALASFSASWARYLVRANLAFSTFALWASIAIFSFVAAFSAFLVALSTLSYAILSIFCWIILWAYCTFAVFYNSVAPACSLTKFRRFLRCRRFFSSLIVLNSPCCICWSISCCAASCCWE